MKPFDNFVVEIESRFNDTLTLSNGQELFVDTRFDEFAHRTVEGKVIAPPFKYDTGVKEGDTLYFHHHVVIQKGQQLPLDNENHYLVKYDDEQTLACQAIAYKDQKSGEIKTLGGWLLLEKIEKEKEQKSSILEVVSFEKEVIDCGRFTTHNKKSEHLDVKEGEVVYFRPGIAYEITIDGVDYLRMRPEDLMYVKT